MANTTSMGGSIAGGFTSRTPFAFEEPTTKERAKELAQKFDDSVYGNLNSDELQYLQDLFTEALITTTQPHEVAVTLQTRREPALNSKTYHASVMVSGETLAQARHNESTRQQVTTQIINHLVKHLSRMFTK